MLRRTAIDCITRAVVIQRNLGAIGFRVLNNERFRIDASRQIEIGGHCRDRDQKTDGSGQQGQGNAVRQSLRLSHRPGRGNVVE